MVAGNGQKQSAPAPPGLILSPTEIPANFHQVAAEISEKMRAMWQTTNHKKCHPAIRVGPAGITLPGQLHSSWSTLLSPAQPDNERPMHIVIRPG